jgi:hypothetical protein
MTPAQWIAQLDRFLAEGGEDIVLLREDDDGGVPLRVDCRARVDRASTAQVAAGIAASDYNLILSPTQILAAGWPDGNPAHCVPEENGRDKVILRGQPQRTIVLADAKAIANQVVRINLRVSG